jgi:hypothetical protein
MYGLLADAVVVVHLLFIVFVIFGGLFALKWPWFPWLHIPAALWGAATEFFRIICPLTPLEQALRARSGGASYSGDFVTHYIVPVIYPSGLTEGIQWVLGAVLVLFNISVYFFIWRRKGSHAA